MSDNLKKRCPRDDLEVASVPIAYDFEAGESIEMGVQEMVAIQAISMALIAVTTVVLKEDGRDALEKVAAGVAHKTRDDPHSLCPLGTILSWALALLTGDAEAVPDGTGNLQIEVAGGLVEATRSCLFEEEDNGGGRNEEALGGDDAEDGGGGAGEVRGPSEDSDGIEAP